jgi:predicted adenine nucleotide alpha hydrolase (AANH) superfamily ATPase
VDIFYYNPNITCEGEFLKRLSEQKRYCYEVYGDRVKVIETEHRSNDFYAVISGLENLPERSKRCYECYALRLKETANYAKMSGYDYFATTLTVSPHKNEKWLNEIGERLEKELSVKYLPTDFKKEGGYLRSIELSKEYDLYRQDFCGCIFSRDKLR